MTKSRSIHLMGLLACIAVTSVGCGDDDETATPARTTSSVTTAAAGDTPFPEADGAELVAGKAYTTRKFQPALTITPSSGEWKAYEADDPDHIALEPRVDDPVDLSTLAFHHMTKVFDPEKGGTIPGDAIDAPDDFAKWLTDHPHLKTTQPKPVEALGLKGVSVDVRVKSAMRRVPADCGKVGGKCVVLFLSKIEPVIYGETGFGRFYVLEQPDGKELVVEQFVEPASAFKAQREQFEATLDSAKLAAG
jgi:hypothetical protein